MMDIDPGSKKRILAKGYPGSLAKRTEASTFLWGSACEAREIGQFIVKEHQQGFDSAFFVPVVS
jgi:hypothetical protein